MLFRSSSAAERALAEAEARRRAVNAGARPMPKEFSGLEGTGIHALRRLGTWRHRVRFLNGCDHKRSPAFPVVPWPAKFGDDALIVFAFLRVVRHRAHPVSVARHVWFVTQQLPFGQGLMNVMHDD